MSARLVVHAYASVDVLDIVFVLFHSGVFEYIDQQGFGVRVSRGGRLCISVKRIYVRRENTFGRLRTKLRGSFGNINVP